MSMIPIEDKVYDDGRTKQSYKDSTDINKILKKAQREGSLSHAMKYPAAVYGEFAGIDLLSAYELCGRAQGIFDDLPSEVRNEFDNDAFKFAEFASDPSNVNRLEELLPALAEPGPFFPNPVKRVVDPPGGPQATQADQASAEPSTSATAATVEPAADIPAEPDASSST